MKLYASSDDLTLFGGRVELGDPADLPLTIKTDTEAKEWHISNNSSRHDNLGIAVVGCNMAASRSLFQKLGHFDTKLGAGTAIGGGEDVDLVYRSYLKGAHIKYAPEIVVYHFHGRRLEEDGKKLTLRYSIGAGALYAKYILRHPNFCRSFYWDLRKMINDIKRKENNFRPDIGLTYVDLIGRNIAGALLFYYVSFLSLFKNNTVRKGH